MTMLRGYGNIGDVSSRLIAESRVDVDKVKLRLARYVRYLGFKVDRYVFEDGELKPFTIGEKESIIDLMNIKSIDFVDHTVIALIKLYGKVHVEISVHDPKDADKMIKTCEKYCIEKHISEKHASYKIVAFKTIVRVAHYKLHKMIRVEFTAFSDRHVNASKILKALLNLYGSKVISIRLPLSIYESLPAGKSTSEILREALNKYLKEIY
ncbi:hypothetical protein DRO02_04035 [archaeon]|nr:MAG: hypothetical protein DRO02_04035 [archaeon]